MITKTKKQDNYPKVGQVFELTMPSEITGVDLLVNFFRLDANGWESNVEVVPPGTTDFFKLIEIDDRPPNPDAVIEACCTESNQSIPSSTWIQVFHEKFGSYFYSSVAIADFSWISPDGIVCFPTLIGGVAGTWGSAPERRDFEAAYKKQGVSNHQWLVKLSIQVPLEL